MLWQDYVGYVGSFLLLSTFYMKTMIPLRVAGIGANMAMIAYSISAGLYPVLAAQLCLLPINIYRLVQMQRLILRAAKAHDFAPQALVPFMTAKTFADGDVLFRVGDEANEMYLIKKGEVYLRDGRHTLTDGMIFGEIGVVAAKNKRTDTAVCRGKTELLFITRKEVRELFFQHPEFGFFLMRLVTERLLHNLGKQTA